MTNFFEFFFSGPNWGWRLLGLIWLITATGEIFIKLTKVFLDYKVNKLKTNISEALYKLKYPDKTEDNDKDEKSPATIDDFRQ